MQAQEKGPNEAVCSSADSAEVVQCYAIYFVQFTYLDDDVAISAKMSAGIQYVDRQRTVISLHIIDNKRDH